MSWEAWVVLLAILSAFVTMVRGWAPTEIALGTALSGLTLLGILEPRDIRRRKRRKRLIQRLRATRRH